MSLTIFLDKTIELECSDLHLCVGEVPTIRHNGVLKVFSDYGTPVTDVEFNELIQLVGLYDAFLKVRADKKNMLDRAITYGGRRFRVHLYNTVSGWSAAFRLLQDVIPNLTDLLLPESFVKLTNTDSGLIIVTGATGSGKTTTLAGFVNEINKTQQKHVVTIEDPVEYVFNSNKCIVNQREVGSSVESFAQATVDAMREDPDVIVLGEMRDKETISNALILAETGHLVLATLHAKSVVEAINRVVDVFPAEQQQQVRIQFSSVCRAILHQRLLTGNKARVPLCELLVTNDVSRKMLQDARNVNEIRDFMRSDTSGSQHIADNAAWHFKNGRLDKKAMEYVLSVDDLRLAVAKAGV